MKKPFKLLQILCLALCLVAVGALAPMEEPEAVWGDDDPKQVVEVFRTGNCKRYSSGFWDYWKGIITGRKFEYCSCIPVDIGELGNWSDILSNLGTIFKSIPGGFWSGEIDLAIKTKDPQLENTMKKVWAKHWIEDGGARMLVIQAEAMIKSIQIARSAALRGAYDSNTEELKKAGYRFDYRQNPSALDKLAWMPAGDYTGITPMSDEETRLNNRWRVLHFQHLKAMKAIGDKYDNLRNDMASLYSELINDDGEKDPFGNVRELYNKVSELIENFKKALNVKESGLAGITQIPSLISGVTDVMNSLKDALNLGSFGFNKRMVLYQLLDALLDDVIKNWQMWLYAVLDKNPTYPLGLIKDSITPVMKDMMMLLFIVAPEKGQTKMLQLATAMADQQTELAELNDHAVAKFQDIKMWSDQAKNAKKAAIKSNVATIAHDAATVGNSGKSHKIGF